MHFKYLDDYSAGRFEKRKGSSGRGGGSSSSSGKSSSSSSKSSSGSAAGEGGDDEPGTSGSGSKGGPSPKSSSPKIPIQSSGKTVTSQAYGNGVSRVSTIPSGQPFAGRTTGGGVRANVFGTRQYGSGYPGISTPGVVGRSFPFGYWPVTYGLFDRPFFDDGEYGAPSNSSRPGGPLYTAPFQPMNGSSTYRVLSDNTTVNSLITSITANCSVSTKNITASPFNPPSSNQSIAPEEVIQYYRASSIALLLDGYNNTAAFSPNGSVPNTPLPSDLDMGFLNCINQTIGAAAPLFDGASSMYMQHVSNFSLIFVIFVHFLQSHFL